MPLVIKIKSLEGEDVEKILLNARKTIDGNIIVRPCLNSIFTFWSGKQNPPPVNSPQPNKVIVVISTLSLWALYICPGQ